MPYTCWTFLTYSSVLSGITGSYVVSEGQMRDSGWSRSLKTKASAAREAASELRPKDCPVAHCPKYTWMSRWDHLGSSGFSFTVYKIPCLSPQTRSINSIYAVDLYCRFIPFHIVDFHGIPSRIHHAKHETSHGGRPHRNHFILSLCDSLHRQCERIFWYGRRRCSGLLYPVLYGQVPSLRDNPTRVQNLCIFGNGSTQWKDGKNHLTWAVKPWSPNRNQWKQD